MRRAQEAAYAVDKQGAILVLIVFLLSLPLPGRSQSRDVTDDRLLSAESDDANWLMYNRTYKGWRYSPLDQISV